MHNNIMTASSNGRPLMLAMGRYAQWKSRFLRYIDTTPNGDALRKFILQGPYIPSTVTIPAVLVTYDTPTVLEQTTVETILNAYPENKAHYESEKEAIHFLLTGIGDEIYSTVDACKTTHEIWIAIERIQRDESFNIQYNTPCFCVIDTVILELLRLEHRRSTETSESRTTLQG
nr:hypothetical protein [Tanacetum cinerariifolium]